MPDESTPQQDPATGVVVTAPWRVSSVRALDGYRLMVRFVDGTEGEVDVSRLVNSDDPGVFAALRDPRVFVGVHVVLGAVTWPGDIDLAPDAMYDEIRANGRWDVE